MVPPRHSDSCRQANRGLTAIEVVGACVVIAAIVIIGTIYVRRIQLAQLQAVADAEPLKVFAFSAVAKKTTFDPEEEVLFHLEVFNPTSYDLDLKWAGIACIFPRFEQGSNRSRFNPNPRGTLRLRWEKVTSFDDTAEVLEDSWTKYWEKPQERVHKIPSKSRALYRLSAGTGEVLGEMYRNARDPRTGEITFVLQPSRMHVANPRMELPRVTFQVSEPIDE